MREAIVVVVVVTLVVVVPADNTSRYVVTDGAIDLVCPVADDGAAVVWMVDDVVVATDRHLSLTDVQESDANDYVCEAEEDSSHTFELIVVRPTSILDKAKRVNKVKAGSDFEADCPIEIDPQLKPSARVVWNHMNSSWSSSRLHFPYVTDEMAGKYICKVVTAIDSMEAEVDLDVIFDVPKVEVRHSVVKVESNGDVKLQCQIVQGIPKPKIEWRFDNHPNILSKTPSLLLANVTRDRNEGKYVCTAVNEYGYDRRQVLLEVFDSLSTVNKHVDVVVESGDEVQFDCQTDLKFDSRSKMEFTWNKVDNKDFSLNNQSVLVIENVSKSHSGVYKCLICTESSTLERFFNLKVLSEPPTATTVDPTETLNVFVTENNDAIITCPVTGIPAPTISWHIQNDSSVLARQESRVNIISDSLHISSVSMMDAATYECEAINMYGMLKMSTRLVVLASELKETNRDFQPPVLLEKPNATTVVVDGHQVRLECLVQGFPWPRIEWKTNVDRNMFSTSVEHISSNNSVKARLESKGSWRPRKNEEDVRLECHASNEVGAVNALTHLVLAEATRVVVGNYDDDDDDNDDVNDVGAVHRVRAGDRVRVPCTVAVDARYNRLRSIEWQRLDDTERVNDTERANDRAMGGVDFGMDGSLVFAVVHKRHEGSYRCTATTSLDKASADFVLRVTANAPVITATSALSQVVFEGSDVSLVCAANGVPRPSISWTLNNTAKLVQNDGEVSIQDAIHSDSGIYTCLASNEYGETRRHLGLRVISIPSGFVEEITLDDNEDINLKCIDDPEVKVQWLFLTPEGEERPQPELQHPHSPQLNLQHPTAGKYICMMETVSKARLNLTTSLKRLQPLTMISKDELIESEESRDVQLDCLIASDQLAVKRVWKFNGHRVMNGSLGRWVLEDKLLIDNINALDHQGLYECHVTAAGQGRHVHVQYRLLVTKQRVTTSPRASSSMSASISHSPSLDCPATTSTSITRLERVNASTLLVSWTSSNLSSECFDHMEITWWSNATQSPFNVLKVFDNDMALINFTDHKDDEVLYIQVNVVDTQGNILEGATRTIHVDQLDLVSYSDEHSHPLLLLTFALSGVLCVLLLLLWAVTKICWRSRSRKKRLRKEEVMRETKSTDDFMQNLTPQWPEPEEPHLLQLHTVEDDNDDKHDVQEAFLKRPESISSSWSSLFNVSTSKMNTNRPTKIRPMGNRQGLPPPHASESHSDRMRRLNDHIITS